MALGLIGNFTLVNEEFLKPTLQQINNYPYLYFYCDNADYKINITLMMTPNWYELKLRKDQYNSLLCKNHD